MKKILAYILLFFFINIGYDTYAIINPINFYDGDNLKTIGKDLSILKDSTNLMTINDVFKSTLDSKSNQNIPFLGISDNTYWFKFSLINHTDKALLLNIDFPILDSIELFELDKNGEILNHIRSGDEHPHCSKKYDFATFLFDLNHTRDSISYHYLKIKTDEIMILPIYIGTKDDIISSTYKKEIVFSLYIGILGIMFLYNLFLFFSIKDISYIYYVGYLLFIALTHSTLEGYSQKYLFYNSPIFANKIMMVNAGVSGIFMILLQGRMLQISNNIRWAKYFKFLVICLILMAVFFTFIDKEGIGYRLIDISGLLFVLYTTSTTIVRIYQRNTYAIFFLTAWILFLVALILYDLKDFGLIPHNLFTHYLIQVGTVFEAFIISLALAFRINKLKKEKEKSQSEALELALENERIIEEQKEALEEKVNLRTQELNEANLELERQALSAQMDPHFIFNSLNSIQNFILKNDKFEAQKYLSKFSKLMRFYLNSSRNELVDLVDEINAIHTYLELERLRFQNKFSFSIKVDPKIDPLHTQIPSMLIIPFLENAVWHGVIKRNDTEGEISITLSATNDAILCHIEDNGIGYYNSQKVNKLNKNHKSAGIEITKNRLKVLHKSLNSSLDLTINELSEQQHYAGTLVQFTIPCL